MSIRYRVYIFALEKTKSLFFVFLAKFFTFLLSACQKSNFLFHQFIAIVRECVFVAENESTRVTCPRQCFEDLLERVRYKPNA